MCLQGVFGGGGFGAGLVELPDKVPAVVLELILKDCDNLKLELPLTSEVISFLEIVNDHDVSVQGGEEAIIKFKSDNVQKEVNFETDEKIQDIVCRMVVQTPKMTPKSMNRVS
eukprot:GHVR01172424.1.p3 GENE.GHVR01172424.1~~GHVR01172424.1.p3  ORF type:complete len:113 (-),score=21.43 GHVR01172424.1:24-362(-)